MPPATGTASKSRAPAPAPTLDAVHTAMMDGFERSRAKADALDLEADGDASPARSRTLRARAAALRRREHSYLLDAAPEVFEYFEEKQGVSEGAPTRTRVLNSFFFGEEEATRSAAAGTERYLERYQPGSFRLDRYTVDTRSCPCGGETVPIASEGMAVCRRCGVQTRRVVESERPSYREPPKEVCFYAYKRINHFREILAQFQAKETTYVPPEVIASIRAQVRKERLTLDCLTNHKTKDVLKKLGLNKYYEHIPFIKDKLGIRPPVMSPQLEEKLCSLFLEVEKQYAKHCPDHRVNFLNYYYVLYKMCELLDERRFLKYFQMLKDPVKRIEQDVVWAHICRDLNWKFIPTV